MNKSTIKNHNGVSGIRTRSRLAVPVAMQKPSLQEMAQEVFIANEKMNEAKREHENGRERLLDEMKKQKAKPFVFDGVNKNGEPVKISTKVETPVVDYIDVKVLFEVVKDQDTLLKILSATKKSVTDHVGGVICTQATKTTKGTENVFVKAVKE